MQLLLPFSRWLYSESNGIAAKPHGSCMSSGVYARSFGKGCWFRGFGRAPDFRTSVLVDVMIGLTYLIQKIHESSQFRFLQGLNVRSQILATEKSEEELLIDGVHGVGLLKPSLNIGNRRRDIRSDWQYGRTGRDGGVSC